MFDVPPKCPALADKLTGIFGWRHTYRVSQKHKGLSHTYLQKSYSLTLPRKGSGSFSKVNLEPESWVAVHHLQTQSGILDPDDCLRDVADDREQILASFEDSGPDPGVQQGGGDGASGSSSVGTGSPDIFRDPTNTEATTGSNVTDASTPHIEVTSTTSSSSQSGLGLQVRRSSDPNLIQSLQNEMKPNKRWSAAAPACGSDIPERILDKVNYLSPQFEEEDDTHQPYPTQQTQNFARSGRLSMQFLGDGNGYKWMEAAEKLQNNHCYPNQSSSSATMTTSISQPIYTTKSLPRETGKRKEPLGQAYESIREKDGEMLLIINEYGGPLGLTAIPDREIGGLLVQHVEKDSRAERGRLRKGDRILEINGTKLVGLAEIQVQDHLRRSIAASELRVRVIRANKAKAIRNDTAINIIPSEMVEIGAATAATVGTKVATVSPTKKIPGAQVGSSLQVANTRKLGRKIDIILKKGTHGLGFSVTTRDNPAGGHCPIYIKNILPRGAAIEDGRLKPGDRLLEVDGVPMTGKSQSDVVGILRATQMGATVKIVVSRQQELTEFDERGITFSEEQEKAANNPPKPPAPVLPLQKPQVPIENLNTSHNSRQKDLKSSNDFLNISTDQHFIDGGSESATSADSIHTGIAWRNREVLTLHIPVHDTEKAGLGVSVKGKTSSGNSSSGSNKSMKHDGDLGIFVKNVLHGGAASRDGRLRMNDQLLSVNGVSLLGQNNAEAMETLRRAMLHTSAKHPGVITLSVARHISRSQSSGDIIERDKERERERERDQHDSSNNSEHSGATVIYLSPDERDLKNNQMNRWSNPVLDRLTGGVCSSHSQNQSNKRPSPLLPHALRNDSYYIATNDTWSSVTSDQHLQQMHLNAINNSVLIEDDPEPLSPSLPHRPNDTSSTQQSSISIGPCDATYSSQLSLETNNSAEAFSRDAIGRRSISEKHHAALDARETGTYQRNKKLREERERERRLQLTKSAYLSGSIESITNNYSVNSSDLRNGKKSDLTAEALDKISDLGPSLGMKKSSSLESLQTMVQEIQMSDDTRGGPSALKAPRGRGREDSLRAAVVAGPETKPRKHWLLEDGVDADGGFSNRNGPFQSSLNDGKHKSRAKKPSILRGIGHMFRFGKHRKDGVVPVETVSEFGGGTMPPPLPPNNVNFPLYNGLLHQNLHNNNGDKTKTGPPTYQPPPPPTHGVHPNDIYNHRYQHYVNYEEIQNPMSYESNDELSESVLESMRLQVMLQRSKVEEESRRHQHYHSQRSARSQDVNFHSNHHHKINNHNNLNHHVQNHNTNNNNNNHHQQQQQQPQQSRQHILAQIGGRPISSYYEYETVQHNVTALSSSGRAPKMNSPPNHRPTGSPSKHWKASTMNSATNGSYYNVNLGGSGRSRGPFVTQVTIRDQSQLTSSSSSKNNGSQNGSKLSQQQQQQQQQQQPIYGIKISGQQQQPTHASKV